jgi:hypothetical protein
MKFTQLPQAGALDGSEITCLVKNGVSVQAPVSAFSGYLPFAPEVSAVAPVGISNNISLGTTRMMVVATTLGAAAFSGFSGGTAGRPLLLVNTGPNLLSLLSGYSGSIPANQLYGPSDFAIAPGTSAMLVYSDTLLKWVIAA